MRLVRTNGKNVSVLLWLSISLLFFSGVLLLIITSDALAEARWTFGGVARDTAKELGIALIVSCIVAVLFEIYRSQSHTFDGMKAVIDATLSEQISAEVWMELKDLIATKECIRRRARVRLEFATADALPAHQRILHVEYEYELHALTSKPAKVSVRHELDYQNCCPELGLPRFGLVTIETGGKTRLSDSENLRGFSSDGRFCLDVTLQPPNKRPVIVRTERSEVVTFPGAYNLYTPEFMKDVSITVAHCPPEIVIEVIVRPFGKGQKMLKAGDTWSCDHLLLPGQGIEVKMQRVERTLFDPGQGVVRSDADATYPAAAEA